MTTTSATTRVRIHAGHLPLPDGTPAVAIDHPYREGAWLPRLGPTAWLLWGTVARRLADEAHPSWTENQLAHNHGVNVDTLHRSLDRLTSFSLARPDGPDRWLVATECPPLWPSLFRRTRGPVRRLHALTFPHLRW